MNSIRYDVRDPIDSQQGVQLLYCAISRYTQAWGSVLHSHAHAELFYCTQGQGWLQIADERRLLQPGDCFLINPYVMHTEFSAPQEPLEYIVMGLGHVGFIDENREGRRYSLLCDRGNQHALLPYFQDVLRELSRAQPLYREVCGAIIDVLLMKFSRYTQVDIRQDTTDYGSSECAEAKRLLDERFQDALTLDWLAQQVGISKFYLSRSFRQHFGTSPMHYLCQRRIQEAMHLLVNTDHSQEAIAQLSGFSSASYLSQAFKRVAGLNPSDYRRRSRQQQPPSMA